MTFLGTPNFNDNVTINGEPFEAEKHGTYFAGSPVDALNYINRVQTDEGWRALWMGTRKHVYLSTQRRRIGHHTMKRIQDRELIRRVSFNKPLSKLQQEFSYTPTIRGKIARFYGEQSF